MKSNWNVRLATAKMEAIVFESCSATTFLVNCNGLTATVVECRNATVKKFKDHGHQIKLSEAWMKSEKTITMRNDYTLIRILMFFISTRSFLRWIS